MPTRVQSPAMPPKSRALKWYSSSRDPDRLGPGLRDHQAADVADEDHQDAEVEQRRADPQQPRLVQLGGPGGPAELVVAVAPDRAADQRSPARGRAARPRAARPSASPPVDERQQPRVVRLQPDGLASAARPRPSPAPPAGRPARRRAGSRRPRPARAAYGRCVVDQREPEQLEAGPVAPAAGRRRPPGRPARRTPAPAAGSRAARRAVSTRKPLSPVALLERRPAPRRGAGCRRRSSRTGRACACGRGRRARRSRPAARGSGCRCQPSQEPAKSAARRRGRARPAPAGRRSARSSSSSSG